MDEYLAKGKRGHVFLRELAGKKVLVKRKNPASAVDTISQEARFTKKLNEHGIGPRFISYDKEKGELVREYVEGEELRKWFPAAEKKAVRELFLIILEQCKTMDDLGINKLEMNHPWKHIIIPDADLQTDKPVMIDFERCKETLQPKNVTQFAQFMTSTTVMEALRRKEWTLNAQKIIEIAKKYKQSIKNNDEKLKNMLYDQLVEVVTHG
jgi:predicted Ser/Thr protein kinase